MGVASRWFTPGSTVEPASKEATLISVRYVGRHDAVTVPLPDGREPLVVHGDTVQTNDEHAAELLEQEQNWQPVNQPAKAGKKEE